MLVKNAQNLMRAVIKTVYAAEAACMKVCLIVTKPHPFFMLALIHIFSILL